jgi:DNA invertase Pin-like site-specific DNA recombinase
MTRHELAGVKREARDTRRDIFRRPSAEDIHETELYLAGHGLPPPSLNTIEDYRSFYNSAIIPENTTGMKYGYDRISPVDENLIIRLHALKEDGCCNPIFMDEDTGATTKTRPELLKCLKALKAGDTLTVWKLARLAPTVRAIVDIGNDLRKRGIFFRSLCDKIDTSTPRGEFLFQHFAAVAEFQRDITIERGREGLKAARARGVKTGPARRLTPQQIEHARELIEHGEPRQDVAELLNVKRTTLWRALKNDTPDHALSVTPPRRPAKRKAARKAVSPQHD